MISQSKTFRLLFISAIAFILLLSVLSSTRITALIESGKLVTHTAEVSLELEKLIGNLKDAETGQRGYLITHKTSFLEPFYAGLKEYPVHLKKVGELVKDNPDQQNNLSRIKNLFESRQRFLVKMIEIDKTHTPTPAEMTMGKLVMDSIRERVKIMEDIENDLMRQRTARLRTQSFLAPALLFVFSIIALAMLILSFWQLNILLKKQHLIEKNLYQKNIALEKMNEELSSFTYISSHDLQEPLRKIQMFGRRIQEKEINVLSTEGKHYFSRMLNAAERSQELINDLLAYSRTNSTEQLLKKTDLNVLLNEVKQELHEKIVSTNAAIESEKLPELPVIAFQFKQLFTNIITNAIKFSRPGIAPKIKISSDLVDETKIKAEPNPVKGKYYKISITDNGIGFDPQFNEQIFGVFQRLHGRTEYAGTGIGLAIVKKIVENHNGFVTANGDLDKGATFNIYIPES